MGRHRVRDLGFVVGVARVFLSWAETGVGLGQVCLGSRVRSHLGLSDLGPALLAM